MSYTKEFYRHYSDYLLEPTVRKSHDWIFNILRFNNCFDYVLDLGCGLGEFKKYYRPRSYMGIDLNMESFDIKKLDYRNCNLRSILGNFKPLSFVSLFSSEITASVQENYAFYEKLFTENKFKYGLVSGFYYASKKRDNIVQENGGLTSHQTLEEIDQIKSKVFSERRIILNVPSSLFGEDVYEVWKIFEANR